MNITFFRKGCGPGGGGINMYMQIDEESVIIKISVIILKEKSLNNFDYSPKGEFLSLLFIIILFSPPPPHNI